MLPVVGSKPQSRSFMHSLLSFDSGTKFLVTPNFHTKTVQKENLSKRGNYTGNDNSCKMFWLYSQRKF